MMLIAVTAIVVGLKTTGNKESTVSPISKKELTHEETPMAVAKKDTLMKDTVAIKNDTVLIN